MPANAEVEAMRTKNNAFNETGRDFRMKNSKYWFVNALGINFDKFYGRFFGKLK